jgi:lipoprotein NlpI
MIGAYLARGYASNSMKDYAAAIADFSRVIEMDPKRTRAWLNRARAKQYGRDLEGALADYDRALELDPTEVPAYWHRSHVRTALGRLDAALEDANRAIALDSSAISYNTRGSVKKASGNLAGATADFDRAIELNPQYAWSYTNRGVVETMNRNWEGALQDYRRFCELSAAEQDYPRLFMWLVCARQGKTSEADQELAAYLNRRKAAKPDEWAANVANFLLGRLSETELFAAAKSPDAKKETGNLCEAWYYAGAKKLLAGDNETAAQYFAKCLATDQKDFIEYEFAKAELKALGR